MSDGDSTRVNEPGKKTARSKEAARISDDPDAPKDDYGTRSDYLRKMDMKSRETSTWMRGPTKEAKKAAAIVDAANKARVRARAQWEY